MGIHGQDLLQDLRAEQAAQCANLVRPVGVEMGQ